MVKKSKTTRQSSKRRGRKKKKSSARTRVARASAKKTSSRAKTAKKKTSKAKVKSAKKNKKKTSRGSSKKKVAKRVAAKKASTVRRKKVKRGAAANTASRRGTKKVTKRVAAKEASTTRRKKVKRVVASRGKKAGRTNTKAVAKVAAKRTVASSRNSAPSPTSQDPIQFPEEARVAPKTYLNAAQLAEFKERLLQKRHELSGDVQNLARDAFQKDAQDGERTMMPIHMAELGSDNWEHEFTLGLIENEQVRMRQIDDALARIDKKTYGMCVATHRRISVARLRAKPWAKYCIEHARAREAGHVR